MHKANNFSIINTSMCVWMGEVWMGVIILLVYIDNENLLYIIRKKREIKFIIIAIYVI